MHIKHWPVRLAVVVLGIMLIAGIAGVISSVAKINSDDFTTRYFKTEVTNAPCLTAEDGYLWLNEVGGNRSGAPLNDPHFAIFAEDKLSYPTCSIAHVFQKDKFFGDVGMEVTSVFIVLLALTGLAVSVVAGLSYVYGPYNSTESDTPSAASDEVTTSVVIHEIKEPDKDTYEPPVAEPQPVST